MGKKGGWVMQLFHGTCGGGFNRSWTKPYSLMLSQVLELERKISIAQRERDAAKAADLKYGALPEVQNRLRDVTERIEKVSIRGVVVVVVVVVVGHHALVATLTNI